MFEKEAEEYIKEHTFFDEEFGLTSLDVTSKTAFQEGAKFGYNKGYHDAEEHYLNVIDNQHKLVNESKKKYFRKCMKCTDGTYQSGFKDAYNKANEWHYVKDGDLPPLDTNVLVIHRWARTPEVGKRIKAFINSSVWVWAMCSDRFRYTSDDENVIAWKEIVLPKE